MTTIIEGSGGTDFQDRNLFYLIRVFVLGGALSILGWVAIRQQDNRALREILAHEAATRAEAFRMHLADAFMPLDAFAAYRAASPIKDYANYRAFVAPLKEARRGVNSIDWAPCVAGTARADFEERMQREGFPGFRIRDRKAQGEMVPSPAREIYYPVQYQMPIVQDGIALGYDLGSNPTRLEGMIQARDLGVRVATGRIVLVEEPDPSLFSVLVYQPIYRAGIVAESPEARKEHLEGFIIGVLRVRDILEASLLRIPRQDVNLTLYDYSAPEEEQLLYHHPGTEQDAEFSRSDLDQGPYTQHEVILVGGRKWVLVLSPSPTYIASHLTWWPWITSATVLVSTLLLCAYLNTLQTRNWQINQLVSQRTDQLSAANATLGAAQLRLHAQVECLGQLPQGLRASTEKLPPRLKQITVQVAQTLKVERVSLWGFSADRSILHCLSFQDTEASGRISPEELRKSDHPGFFAALESTGMMATAIAHSATETRDLSTNYLDPLGITSMMAIPLSVAGRVVGVLCAEHRGVNRTWFPDELAFAFATGQHVSLLLGDRERRQTEDRFRLVWESSTDGLRLTDDQGVILQVNSALCHMIGLSEVQLVGHPITVMYQAERALGVLEQHNSFLRSGNLHAFRECEVPLWNGRKIWFEVTRCRLPQASEPRPLLLTIYRDITARKHQALLVEQTHRAACVGGWEQDLLTNKLTWTEETYRLHEVTPEEYTPEVETALAFYSPEDLPRLLEAASRGREQGTSWECELSLITKNEKRRWVHVVGKFEVVDGQCVRMYGSFQDITGRKDSDAALQQTASTLQDAMALGRMGSFQWNQIHGVVTWSPELYAIYGVDPGTPITLASYLSQIHPEDLERVQKTIGDTLESGKPFAHEYRIVRSQGEIRWVMARGAMLHGPGGYRFGLRGVCQDITELKEAEQAIRQLNEELEARVQIRTAELQAANVRLAEEVAERRKAEAAVGKISAFRETIIRTAAEGICVCHAISEPPFVAFTVWNERMTQVTGYTMEEINRLGWYQSLYPDLEMQTKAMERMREMRQGNDLVSEEWVIRRKDGIDRTVAIVTSRLEWEQQDSVVALIQDVTERKQVESQLRASEARFRLVVESLPTAIIVVNAQGKIVLANAQAERGFGYESTEWSSLSVEALLPTHYRASHVQLRNNYLKDPETRSMGKGREIRAVHKNGAEFPVEIGLVPMATDHGMMVLATIIDITERKESETILREQELRLRQMAEASDQVFWLTNRSASEILYVSPAFASIWGIPCEELYRDPNLWMSIIHPEDKARVHAIFDDWLNDRNADLDVEYRIFHPKGNVRWIHGHGVAIRDEQGQIYRCSGVSRDITAARAAREELQQRARLMELGANVGLALARGGDLGEALKHCTEALVKSLDAAFARIWTVIETEQILELQASSGLYTHCDGLHARIPIGKFKIGRIAFEGKPHLTNDVMHDPLISDLEWATREGMVAFAGFPLIVEGRVVGVIAMFARKYLEQPTLDALAWVATGIAQSIQRKRTEIALQASLREKEALLKEVHHRVKNNLQIICSLLNLQASSIQDASILSAFRESQNRVRSMALIHEALYRFGDLARIDFSVYADTLCAQLYRSYGADPARITLSVEVFDVSLDVDRAIPTGLIINELVSNALKYAFPGERPGNIRVHLDLGPAKSYALTIADDGIGLPKDLDLARLESLGLQLVADLTLQLRGHLEMESQRGTVWRITFPNNELAWNKSNDPSQAGNCRR